jgi:tRNA G18 (ribose-2'-O)-methylase SpoU
MVIVPVAAPDDPCLADYGGLRGLEQRQRAELAAGVFIAEGITVIERMLLSPYRVRSLLLHPRMLDRLRPLIEPLPVPVYVADRATLEAITGFDLHRGALACAERPALRPLGELLAGTTRLAVLEGLNDGENLGAIARSARAFGIDALVVDPTTIDPLYRRAVRVSMGEMLMLPWTRVLEWPHALDEISACGFEVAAFTPADDAIDLGSWKPSSRVAVLLGAEGPGLSAGSFAAAETRVRIPISPSVDSLNVGHAAAVAFHHLRTAHA